MAISNYGNTQYEYGYTDERTTWALFFGGLIVAFSCLPAVKKFLEEVTKSEQRNERIVWFTAFQTWLLLGPIYVACKALLGTADQTSYQSATYSLVIASITVPLFTRWIAKTAPDFRQLKLRLKWLPVQRAVANVAGISAVAAFIAARFSNSYPAPALSAALTLLVAAAVAAHKPFARTRKLCTQSHLDIQNLIRDMEDLSESQTQNRERPGRVWRTGSPRKSSEVAVKQMAALRSWDIVKLNLCTSVDSGYRIIGLHFLPQDEVAALEAKVLAAIAEPDATGPARRDLQAILAVCAARVDVLA
ncbi:hypothetical protein ACIOGT_39060 [Streptomyces microflavus]|uniref:hypothetical protein n=1 Tax=Streptomyces microflavus TaxID=1919 RepID=UPI00381C0000